MNTPLSTLKKDTLTWIAIGVLLFAGIIGLISREMKRQRGRELTARSAVAVDNGQDNLFLTPLTDGTAEVQALGVRYPHRQLAMPGNTGAGAAIAFVRSLGIANFDQGDSWVDPLLTEGTGLFPVIASSQTGKLAPQLWVAWQEQTPHGSTIRVRADTDHGPLMKVSTPEPGPGIENSFPSIATSDTRTVVSSVWTDPLGASGVALWLLQDESASSISIARSSDWQTWQPPDIRLMDDSTLAMVLRAEAPPRMSGKTREVDSAILGWRFDIEGPVPEPEILMPAIPGQFTERPVLAADHDGNLAVAIGHWGTPQPEGLRGYEMTILLAEGMGEWREVTSPIPNQVNIATAQPQLGRIGDSLLLVFAFESNEIASPTAHRIQWVRSLDAGLTWTAPALLLPEPGSGVRDYPLDLIMGRDSATLLLQRQTPAPARKGSIVVDPPTVAMFAAQWDWAQ